MTFFLKAPRSTRESCKISRRGCPSSLGTGHTEDAHHYTHTQHTRTQSPGTQVRTGARTPAGRLPSAGVTAGPEAHPRFHDIKYHHFTDMARREKARVSWDVRRVSSP